METFALLFSQNQLFIRFFQNLTFAAVFLVTIPHSFGQKKDGKLAFTVSMEDPATHLYHITFRCEGIPAGVFLYPEGQLNHPLTVTLKPYAKWSGPIAAGLDSITGHPHTFVAPNYDILYDSPILMGNLEQLPSFTVQGIPHYFIGYNLGNFDRQ